MYIFYFQRLLQSPHAAQDTGAQLGPGLRASLRLLPRVLRQRLPDPVPRRSRGAECHVAVIV